MANQPRSRVGQLRILLALILCVLGAAIAVFALAPTPSSKAGGPRLSISRANFAALSAEKISTPPNPRYRHAEPNGLPVGTPHFGHPVISGIGGTGFEQDLRVDPTNPNRIYTSVPGTAAANTSWIWRSLDGGKTFKWVPNATALEGKVTACNGGGDTELAIDSAGHLYFNDLTLANFSTARSDDFGATFTCSDTGVPDSAVDRQWYTIDGDPTNGGSIYLANDEIGPGGVMCGGSTGNNVLVMYRSPVGGLGATAGVEFGPANKVTAALSCDEAIMGNNELSPVATTLGQPDGLGGYATLPTPVKHIFVVHDNATLNKILIGRCFPVAFGAPLANVSDPSGLNCTDLMVADLGPNTKTGGDFPTMAIDRAGNLYTVWEQAPIDGTGMINGDTVLKYSYSTDQGNTWSAPIQIDTAGSAAGTLHTNVFAWMVAGDDGRVDIVWYGTPGAPTFPSNGPDSCPACDWSLWMVQTLNGHAAAPVFTVPVEAGNHFSHHGNIQTLMGGQTGDRSLGDFLQVRMGAQGEAVIGYADSNNIVESVAPHGMVVRQDGGNGLLAATSPVNIPGLALFNAATDPSGDAKYEVNGVSSATMPQLDIRRSSITQVTTAPCSVVAPCYRVNLELENLSLAPSSAQDPDPDLVWSTQWFVPSTTDPNGGKNFHVYAESTNGGALQCYVGENAATVVGGGVATTYPGNTALPAANCQSTLGPNGSITIYVPLTSVAEAAPLDNLLHEVTASTMTLTQPANTVPSVGGIGGTLFNLIDVAQSYVFDPTLVQAVSRKIHGAGDVEDVPLPLTGVPGVECRINTATSSGANAGHDHRVVVSFPTPLVSLTSVNVTSSDGLTTATFSFSGETVTIDLHNVADHQRLTINLTGINDGTTTTNLAIPMDILAGDTNADDRVNVGDTNQTKSFAGQLTNSENFRSDVNLDGRINVGDTNFVKAHSGGCVGPGCP